MVDSDLHREAHLYRKHLHHLEFGLLCMNVDFSNHLCFLSSRIEENDVRRHVNCNVAFL